MVEMDSILMVIMFTVAAASAARGEYMEQLDVADMAALREIRGSLQDMPGSLFFASWDFSGERVYPCTSFTGVICDYEAVAPDAGDASGATRSRRLRVVELNLGNAQSDSPGLRGALPEALSRLTALRQLTLAPGQVAGHVPHQLGLSLSRLEFLGLSRNQLSGPIPPTLSSLPALHTLDLSFNLLRGPVPPALFSLPSLHALRLGHNRLFGTLPPQIAAPNLLHLDLESNSLSGALPASFPSSLSFLSLASNKFTGGIPASAFPASLYHLDLSDNTLTGEIPAALLALPALHTLLLAHNRLSGALQPAALLALDTLDASYNALGGRLSPLLSTARNLYLNNNKFQGLLPLEFVDQMLSGGLLVLYLQHNLLSRLPLDPHLAFPVSSSFCIDFNCLETPPQSHCPAPLPSDARTTGAALKLQCGL